MGHIGQPGSGPWTIDGHVTITASSNLCVGSGSFASSGQLVIAMAEVITAPASLAALDGLGGVLYVQSGALHFLGGKGTDTVIGSP